MSENEFSTDSIVLKKEDLVKHSRHGALNQVYIGVYTTQEVSVFSLLYIQKTDFNPIKLKLGEILGGTVPVHGKKYYYVEASGESTNSLRIDLIPTLGNPDLEITIISDLSVSHQVWQQKSTTPHHVSENKSGLDTLILDPVTSPPFAQECSSSCIILIAVVNSQADV